MRTDAPLPLTITRGWLNSHNACREQAGLFEETWPDGVGVTQKTLASAAKAGLNLEWFAKRVLPGTTYANYEAMRVLLSTDYQTKLSALETDFQSKDAPLYADYVASYDTLVMEQQTKDAVLFPEYPAKRVLLYGEYQEKRSTLYADYEAKRTPLYTEYKTKCTSLDASYMAKCEVLLVTILGAAYENEANYHEEGQAITTHDHSQVAQ